MSAHRHKDVGLYTQRCDPLDDTERCPIEKVRWPIEKVKPFVWQCLRELRQKPEGIVAAVETSLGCIGQRLESVYARLKDTCEGQRGAALSS